jgi:hypothetical protein
MDRISLFIKSAALTLIVVPLLWSLSLGRYERAEHWLSNVYFAKEHRAAITTEPKILIVSGSNSLFGFDSETLERLVGRPVVNLAGHASLSLDFHINMALKYARAGDLIIMPLELGYYAATPDLTNWQVANMSSWGSKYLDWSPGTLVRYFRRSSFTALLTRVLIRRIPTDSEDKVLAVVEANSANGISDWHGYSYKSMNARGDILLLSTPPTTILDQSYTTGIVTDYSMQRLQWLQARLVERGASLQFTWPATMRSPLFDLGREKDRLTAQLLKDRLTAAGLHVICDPEAFQYERRFFLETANHVNAEAAELRMEYLAACIQNRPSDPSAAEVRYSERRRKRILR